jgi:hypothetical protein
MADPDVVDNQSVFKIFMSVKVEGNCSKISVDENRSAMGLKSAPPPPRRPVLVN